MTIDPKIKFFKTPAEFRKWLKKNHAKEQELIVGFYKKDSGLKSITWPESVDQALCFGWIDGIRRSIDDKSYSIRFTPRKKSSIWSNVNIKKVEELKKLDLMQPAGLAIYAHRKEAKSGIYSFEKKVFTFDSATEKIVKANKMAWEWFKKSAPSYQRTAIHWIMSAKQEKTKERRLRLFIEDCEKQQIMKQYRYNQKK